MQISILLQAFYDSLAISRASANNVTLDSHSICRKLGWLNNFFFWKDLFYLTRSQTLSSNWAHEILIIRSAIYLFAPTLTKFHLFYKDPTKLYKTCWKRLHIDLFIHALNQCGIPSCWRIVIDSFNSLIILRLNMITVSHTIYRSAPGSADCRSPI